MTRFNKNNNNCNVYLNTVIAIWVITSIVFLFEMGDKYDEGHTLGIEQGYERGYRNALDDYSTPETVKGQLKYFDGRNVFYDEYESEENPL